MLFFDYKGCTIYPVPTLIGGSGKWRIALMVRCQSRTRKFSYTEEYGTEGEAVFNCIKHGKKLIDEGTVMADAALIQAHLVYSPA